MAKFNVHVSALATMTASIEVEADTPEQAAARGKAIIDDPNAGRIDWELIDGGRPAPGSADVDAVWDEEDGEEVYEVGGTPAELANTALANLISSRDLFKKAGASNRLLDRIRLAISSAKGAVRHAGHRTQGLVS